MAISFLLTAVLSTAAACALLVRAAIGRRRTTEDRRRRFAQQRLSRPATAPRLELVDSGARVALVEDGPEPVARAGAGSADPVTWAQPAPAREAAATDELPGRCPVPARTVTTPDGQMRLTEPPFLGRGRLLSPSRAAFAERLRRRLPAGLVLCPMVRLEALVEPTAPQGYDPADWRRWRRRVRLRAVHLLLCEAPTWRPVLAILLEAPGCAARAERRPDAITDEVLRHIGLPVVRCDPADRAAFDEHARRIVGLAVSAAA